MQPAVHCESGHFCSVVPVWIVQRSYIDHSAATLIGNGKKVGMQ